MMQTFTATKYQEFHIDDEKLTCPETDINTILTVLRQDLETITPVQSTIVNEAYDSSQTYIPRSKRKEWSPVGMLGKIHVRDDGSCTPGNKCDCINGIATNGSHWFVLERTDKSVIRILYK